MKLAAPFLCFTLLFAITQTVAAKTPEFEQLCALADGVILPFLQCNTNGITTNKSSGFEHVVIVDNAALQKNWRINILHLASASSLRLKMQFCGSLEEKDKPEKLLINQLVNLYLLYSDLKLFPREKISAWLDGVMVMLR